MHASACPVEQWLDFLGHRWSAVVLWHLGDGPLYHAELAARLPGVRPKTLADRLAAHTAQGLLKRTSEGGFPVRVRYALTDEGRHLLRVLDQLAAWAAARDPAGGEPADALSRAWASRPR